jgi:hypothetical protein
VETSAARPDDLAAVLHAASPYPELAGHLGLFGRFTGAWDIEWHGLDADSNPGVMRGELHFGWILDGRALQDVWRVPARDPVPAGLRPFHGTTIRFYDPSIQAWRSTWIDPLNGRVRRFIGRPDEAGITLDGLDDDPAERWGFRDITPDSFRWVAMESTDGRQTWHQNDEMFLKRRALPTPDRKALPNARC